MYIDEVRLSNVRGYTTGSKPISLSLRRPDGTLAGLTVLAGRNGSGKTTLLRALALALVGPGVARNLVPSFAGWISDGESSGFVRVAYQQSNDDQLSGAGAPPQQQTWAGIAWNASDGAQPSVERSIPRGSPLQAPQRGPWNENPRGWFVAAYGPFRRLSGAGAEAQRLMLGNTKTAAMVTLFDETASLAESTWWLQEIYLRVLEKDEKFIALQESVFRILNDGLLPDGARVVRYDSDGLWLEQGGVTLTVDGLSDGYRVVTSLILDIVRRIFAAFGSFSLTSGPNGGVVCPSSGIVLIDELDVHLHVSWQQRIGIWLREHFPNVQFIVSTHSPFICQAASEAGLIRLAAPGESSRAPEVLDDEVARRIIHGGADDAVLSELFGLESAYGVATQAKRRELTQLALSEAEDSARIRELRAELALSPTAEVAQAVNELSQRIDRLRAQA